MKQIIIRENEAGQRLDKFLSKYLSRAPKSFLYKMLRKKNIVLNGKKADGSEKLLLHDEIKLFLADETIDKFSDRQMLPGILSAAGHKERPANLPDTEVQDTFATAHIPKPDIIYENRHICLMNKPCGILSQKAEKDDISMNEIFLNYLLQSGQFTADDMRTFKPAVCNRLDRNTTGILIGGKTLFGLQKMSALLKERSIHKYYLCMVAGKMSGERRIEGYLVKDEASNQVKIYKENPQTSVDEDGQPTASYIQTAYKALATNGRYTLLEVLLVTGRTHQIRAHLASVGCPIAGDTKYGSVKVNRSMRDKYKLKSQFLHSYRLEFPSDQSLLEDGLSELAGMTVCAPLPDMFCKIIKGEQLDNGNLDIQRS